MQATFNTTQAQPVQQGSNGKWCAAFDNWVTRGSETYRNSSCTSAPLFDTAADAEEAGRRAVAAVETTGKFPNMCEKF